MILFYIPFILYDRGGGSNDGSSGGNRGSNEGSNIDNDITDVDREGSNLFIKKKMIGVTIV